MSSTAKHQTLNRPDGISHQRDASQVSASVTPKRESVTLLHVRIGVTCGQFTVTRCQVNVMSSQLTGAPQGPGVTARLKRHTPSVRASHGHMYASASPAVDSASRSAW
jgi:hypothetical protein